MPTTAILNREAARVESAPEAEDTSPSAARQTSVRVLRALVSLLPVPLTAVFQLALWDRIFRPFALFLFVGAIYVSAWFGGLYAGLASTLASLILVYYYFIPPERTWALGESRHVVILTLFVALGILISLFHERFRRTNRALGEALADGRRKNATLQGLYRKTKELDDLKTRLFTGVSHELRTPLSLVIGPAERLVAAIDVDDAVRSDAELIARNARTLLRYVDDLLEVTKLEAHAVELEYADVDLARLARTTGSPFEVTARAKNVAYAVEAPASLRCEIDDVKVQRVLLNLLSNAFKFTPEGGRVRLAVRAEDERGRIVLEVADSGPGIPPEKREAVFDAYLQLEGRSSRRFAGTGLGLSIARELVELQGGSIAATDAPEGGALFVVELPRRAPPGVHVRSSATEAPSEALREEARSFVEEIERPGSGAAALLGRAGRPRVLVVEDNRDMNNAICVTLRADYQVVTAFDGREGLRKALEIAPDVVVTDVMMPEMNGEELVRALRAEPQLRAIPVIVLTAVADERARVRLLREGARDYVTKPFRADELLARVSNAVAQRLAEREVLALTAQLEAVIRASVSVAESVATLPKQSVEAVLRTLASEAQRLTAAEYVAVGLGSDSEKPFEPWVFVGMSPEQAAAIGRHPRPVGVLGVVARGEDPLRTRDLRSHPGHVAFPSGHPQMTSFLGVPIRFRDRAVGHLYLANKRGGDEFTDADQRGVEMLAARAGVALETAHRYEAEATARAWLEAMIEQLPDAIVLLDPSGKITRLNRAASALRVADDGRRDPFGNPIPLELHSPDGALLSPEDLPYVRALRSGEPETGSELLVAFEDRTIPVLASAVAVHGLDGKPAGAVAVFRNVSAQREIERMREEWSAVIAHDLRQPVGVIALATELVGRSHDGPLSDRDAKHLERIRLATRRLTEMIDELLDVTRLESHRLELARAEVDIAHTAREVCDRMGVASSGHRLSVRESGVSTTAWADPARVEQVLANLVSNACKYGAPDTDIGVDVEGREHEIEVSVTNSGRGIPTDELPRMFQRFMRSTTSRASGVSGIGLGLYICKGLIEAHGGRIWVESTPNATTTFHFTLPAARAADHSVGQLAKQSSRSLQS